MAVFRYRMQNILNIKEKIEEQEKQNFAIMRKKLTDEEEKLDALKKRLDEITFDGKRIREDKINVIAIKENTALREYYEGEIKSQLLRVRAAEKNLDNAAIKMQNAIKERKIQEKLKEHAYEEFLVEEGRREAKEIDELTSYVYGQKE